MGNGENDTSAGPGAGEGCDHKKLPWGDDAPYPGRYPSWVNEASHAFGPYLYRPGELLLTAPPPAEHSRRDSLDVQLERLRAVLASPQLRRQVLLDLFVYRCVREFPPHDEGGGAPTVRSLVTGLGRALGLLFVLLGAGFQVPLSVRVLEIKGPVARLMLTGAPWAPDLVPVLVQRLRGLGFERGTPPLAVSPHHVMWSSSHAIGFSAEPPAPSANGLDPLPAESADDRPVIVAVIDNGVDDSAAGTRGSWFNDGVRRVDFLDDPRDRAPATPSDTVLPAFTGHGTFVAGLVLDEARKGRGGDDGPGRPVHVLSVNAAAPDDDSKGAHGYLDDASAADAIDRLMAGMKGQGVLPDVVLLAWGGYVHDGTGLPLVTQALGRLGDLRGAPVVVAAAGNDTTDRPVYPASLKGVVAVAAVKGDAHVATPYTNFGWWVDACTEGDELVAPFPGASDVRVTDVFQGEPSTPTDFSSGWATWTGTSMSAARVAGILARRVATSGLSGPQAWFQISDGRQRNPDLGVYVP